MGAPIYAGHESAELRGYTGIPASGAFPETTKQQLRQGYYASVSYVDAQIGLVLQTLNQLGLADKTVVLLVSDHGFHLGEQGLWTKTSNYELDLRVPLLIAVPAKGIKASRSKALVELIDLFPTLADLCSLPLPNTQGKSFRHLLTKPASRHRAFALSQFSRPWTYKKVPQRIGYTLRTDRFRYTEWRNYQDGTVVDRELYDLDQGNVETINLAKQLDYLKTVQELSRQLLVTVPPKAERLTH